MLSRRSFFGTAGVSAAALLSNPLQVLQARPKVISELGKVKIKDVKTAVVKIKKYKTTLVKVTTDQGIYGIGEAFPKVDVAGHINDVKKEIIGQDPLSVEVLVQTMIAERISRASRMGAYLGAISGIEIALWDLAGKILNVPVYVLLGGKYRDKLLIYHDSGSPGQIDPQVWIDNAQASIDYGFKAIKFSLRKFDGEDWNRYLHSETIAKYTKVLQAVRLSVGPDFPIAIDLHWKFNTRDSIRLAQALEELNLWFIEDPLPPESAESFARLTEVSRVPIATGENLYARQGFKPFIEKQACDIINPDAQKCGGLLEMKRIADWAELYNMSMLCHNLCTPVGTIASGHACMAIKSFLALESDSVEVPYWQDFILRDGSIYKNGYLEISDKPGLGIELNEEVCRQQLMAGSSFFE